MAQKTLRGIILTEALRIINGDRQDQYGNPEDSFALISGLWNVYLGVNIITPKDAMMMMSLFKIARERHQKKQDNLVDACGYLALAADVRED